MHLEIIAPTHRWTIFKTHVFRLYSHQCNYIAIHSHTVYLDWRQAELESNSRCTGKWQSSELRDILRGRACGSLEMHLEAIIEHIWRHTLRAWSNKLRDALGGGSRAYLEIHLEAVFKQIWKCNWRSWSCELGVCNHASLEMDLQAIIELVSRYTWRQWSSELRDALQDRDWEHVEMHFKAGIERI